MLNKVLLVLFQDVSLFGYGKIIILSFKVGMTLVWLFSVIIHCILYLVSVEPIHKIATFSEKRNTLSKVRTILVEKRY